jgi:hypothetical protein
MVVILIFVVSDIINVTTVCDILFFQTLIYKSFIGVVYYYCRGGGKLNKRFPLVLDEECLKILGKVPAKKKAEYVRNAIKHYSECKSLDEKIERLENIAGKLESVSFSPAESNRIMDSDEESDERDYILDGFLNDIENLE